MCAAHRRFGFGGRIEDSRSQRITGASVSRKKGISKVNTKRRPFARCSRESNVYNRSDEVEGRVATKCCRTREIVRGEALHNVSETYQPDINPTTNDNTDANHDFNISDIDVQQSNTYPCRQISDWIETKVQNQAYTPCDFSIVYAMKLSQYL